MQNTAWHLIVLANCNDKSLFGIEVMQHFWNKLKWYEACVTSKAKLEMKLNELFYAYISLYSMFVLYNSVRFLTY